MNAINTAVTGLQAAQTRLSVSADNVANQFSNDGGRVYEAKRVTQTSLVQGGVQARVEIKNPSTVKMGANGAVETFPNVNLEEEVINQQMATYDFNANLKVIERADEAQERLLDIVA